MRDQAGKARDEKDRVPELVGEAEIGADRGDRAVDVHRQRTAEAFLLRLERTFTAPDQPYVLAFELEFEHHLEQPRRPRVARVIPVAKAWRHDVLLDTLANDGVRRLLHAVAVAHQRQAAVEKM